MKFSFSEKARLRTTSQSASQTMPDCGSQRLLRCRLHPAGRCPNSSSLFPPLAAVVAVAPSRGASGETVHFAGTAKASPTRRGGIASAMTERLYKDGPCHKGKALPRLSSIFREKHQIINALSRNANFHPPSKPQKSMYCSAPFICVMLNASNTNERSFLCRKT